MTDVTGADGSILAWHWLPADRKLRHGDGRAVVDGETLTVAGDIEACENGLHASVDILDSLMYAPGPILCRVRCGGQIVQEGDKLASSERTVLWSVDMTAHLWVFARWSALQVIHLWDAPDVVRQYLETGDETLRAAAWAAGAAAGAAARAAWDAARDAASAAASAAAWDAAWDAAGAAARDAAGDAMRDQQRAKLLEIIEVARGCGND